MKSRGYLGNKMADQGKKLESLVKAVEEIFLPAGFEVIHRSKAFNDEGTQLAEFDLEIRGRVGSTDFKWLIECRDRPSEGSAPSSWIEQLVGRRNRFHFDKVTAVSTTGFSGPATKYAKEEGIEIRKVKEINVQGTLDWLGTDSIFFMCTYTRVKKAGALIPKSIGLKRAQAAARVLNSSLFNDLIFFQPDDNAAYSANYMFNWYTKKHPGIISGMKANAEPREVYAKIGTPAGASRLQIITDEGPAEVVQVHLVGDVYLRLADIPVSQIQQYYAQDGAILSESFTESVEFDVGEQVKKIDVGVHRVSQSGEHQVIWKAEPGE